MTEISEVAQATTADKHTVARRVFITLDLLCALDEGLNAAISGPIMHGHGLEHGDPNLGLFVTSIYLVPAVLALVCAAFLWRRWRYHWTVQLSLGSLVYFQWLLTRVPIFG